MKYSIPLALFAAVRTFADGVLLASWSDELYIISEEQMVAGQFIFLVIYKYQE